MRLSHTIEYYSLIAVAWLLCALPRRMALALGASFGGLAWLIGMRRNLVLQNLKQALPDTSEAQRKRIGARAARNFGKTTTEFIRFGRLNSAEEKRLITIEGSEAVLDALQEGKGALLLTGHFGAWASYFAAIALEGVPLGLLVGKQHNERVDQFIHGLTGDRVELISKGKSAIRAILRNLNEGRAVIMVADQHAGRAGLKIPFFGRPTSTLALPSSIAIKYDAPLFTLLGHRTEPTLHHVTIKPLQVKECDTDAERKTEILKAYHRELENAIRQHPDQYFWFHRRWRDTD